MNRVIRFLESNFILLLSRLFALIAFLGVALLGAQYTQLSNHNKLFSECVAQWGTDYTNSVTIRSDANGARTNALNKLLLDAIQKSPGTNADLVLFMQAAQAGDIEAEKAAAQRYLTDATGVNAALLQADVTNFVNTEVNYQNTIKTHPFPAPPALRCR